MAASNLSTPEASKAANEDLLEDLLTERTTLAIPRLGHKGLPANSVRLPSECRLKALMVLCPRTLL